MTRLLFVCSGNTCRSPLAEVLVRREAERRGIDVLAASAGTHAAEGASASPGAVAAARRRGADLTSHRSRSVDGALIAEADRVITMTPGHLQALTGAPDIARKGSLLTDFLPEDHPLRGAGVADPFGGDDAEYERAAGMIETCLAFLLDSLEES